MTKREAVNHKQQSDANIVELCSLTKKKEPRPANILFVTMVKSTPLSIPAAFSVDIYPFIR